jgi:hypothetical protein
MGRRKGSTARKYITNIKIKPRNRIIRIINHPDPKLHQTVSFLKSAVRISGYVALFWSVGLGAVILIISELVGIVEELV